MSTLVSCPGNERLEKLPEHRRKTANVVLNIAFGAPTIAVDTHLFPSVTVQAWPKERHPYC